MSFAPKPPPTSGATIRTCFLSTSSSSARSLRTSNGTCVETPDRVSAVVLGHDGDRVRLHGHRREPLLHDPRACDDVCSLQRVRRPSPARTCARRSNRGREQHRRAVRGRRLHVGHRIERRRPPARPPPPRPARALANPRSPPRPARPRSGPCPGRAPRARTDPPACRWPLHVAARRSAAAIRRSSAVKTAATPGIDRASSKPSMPLTRPCGMMERTNTARSASGIGDVLEVPALAPEESRVFGAEGGNAEHRRRQAHAPMLASNRTHRGRNPCAATGSLVHLLIVLASARARRRGRLGGTTGAGRRGIVATPRGRRPERARRVHVPADGASSTRSGDRADPYLQPGDQSNGRFFTVPGVNGDGERGALGVAVSPGWPHPRALYVYATRSTASGLRNQILKITRSNGHARMRVLCRSRRARARTTTAGRILFGPDGMLYAIVGDGHDSSNCARHCPATSAARSCA